MLEQMRKQSRSLLIYLLFVIVITVFIVNFGPQSTSGCDPQMTGTASDAGKVAGRLLSANDYRYQYMMMGGGQFPPELARAQRLKETVMDKLIERELLAAEAERLGFRVTDEEVEDLIAESKIVFMGREQPFTIVQKDGKFDYEVFKRFVQFQLGMSPRAFLEQQRRELLAARMSGILRSGVNVSDDEVKAEFVRQNDQVNVEYLRFSTQRYESDLQPAPAEIEAYAKANEAKLKELYGQRKFLYEKAPKERKIRQILVKLDSGASKDAEEAALKKAEGLAARVRKGEAFAAVAKAASDDARSKARGGELGWKRQGATLLGPDIEGKLWAAKDGELVGPVKGPDGFYLAVAEGTREGDIPFEQVKLELAEDQLRQDQAKAKARADAEAALAKAKAAGDKALKDLFPASSEAGTDAPAPQAEETGLFARRGAVVEGIGTSPELAKAVFALTKEAPLGGPIEVAGAFVVVKLKERKTPDMAEFDRKRLELVASAAAEKGADVVVEWALRRCQETKEAKRISVNRDLLRYEGGQDAPVSYEPCSPPFRL